MSALGNRLIPSLCYMDAPAAIAWLQEAFGFTTHLVVPGEAGEIVHAQIKTSDGTQMLMIYSARQEEAYRLQRPPKVLGGCNQCLYLVVQDVAAHHLHAVKAGAKITMPPTAQDYGGSCYTCSDPEGHVWNFGSYDPWAE